MKRNRFVILTIVALCILCVGTVACTKPPIEEPQENISYMQQSLYCGKTKDFAVRLATGISEKMFVADGRSDEVGDFATLTLVPQHVDLFNDAYTYTLVGTEGRIEGELTKDSFGASYSTDLADIAKVGTPTSVTVASDNAQCTIELTDAMAGSITADEAKKVAQTHMQDKLDASKAEREIYVKYINDGENEQSAYYWYVAFIAAPTDYYAVLVDGQGKILSVNP